jgi:hypothetical protein
MLLVLSPEGTRRQVRAWKSGYFTIADQAGVPVVPSWIDWSRRVVGFGPRRGHGRRARGDQRTAAGVLHRRDGARARTVLTPRDGPAGRTMPPPLPAPLQTAGRTRGRGCTSDSPPSCPPSCAITPLVPGSPTPSSPRCWPRRACPPHCAPPASSRAARRAHRATRSPPHRRAHCQHRGAGPRLSAGRLRTCRARRADRRASHRTFFDRGQLRWCRRRPGARGSRRSRRAYGGSARLQVRAAGRGVVRPYLLAGAGVYRLREERVAREETGRSPRAPTDSCWWSGPPRRSRAEPGCSRARAGVGVRGGALHDVPGGAEVRASYLPVVAGVRF